MLVLGHRHVGTILAGREQDVVDTVAAAYVEHDLGNTSLPFSTFLRFPDQPANRIIGLPAYLPGGDAAVAGIKWVSSFPGNIASGGTRASATMVLNSVRTGYPTAVLEASAISAQRTAASAALAARTLLGDRVPDRVAVVGCGPINLEVIRYLRLVLPALGEVVAFDRDRDRAARFARTVADRVPGTVTSVADTIGRCLTGAPLVSVATNTTVPHLDLAECAPRAVVLHVSLRDVVPETIAANHNVVDDLDHVCREETSVHRAARLTGATAFVDAELGALLRGTARLEPEPDKLVLFSPFGLGVLDLAVARLVYSAAVRAGVGLEVTDFAPGAAR